MSPRPPNIINILSDDHRSDHLGCHDHPVLETPHLDRLAAEGTRFANAFCTSPICTPSRACHYTGRWERKHAINFNSGSSMAPAAWELGFPMQLKANGYFIGWVGKNHVAAGGGNSGYDSGYFEQIFDYWYGNHHHSGFYPKEYGEGGRIYRNAHHDTQAEVFAEAAFDFLNPDPAFRERLTLPLPERPNDRPVCLCITFNLPHEAGTANMQLRPSDDALYKSAYRDRQHLLQPPPTYVPNENAFENPRLPRHVYNGRYIPQYDYVKQPHTLKEPQVRTCQTISGMDRFVGHLRTQLARLGLDKNTLLVFSTHDGEHGIGGKCFLYEELSASL